MGNSSLNNALKQKQDEFYTQLDDIANELKHYKDHFKNKVVLCNCDDPRVSNFFKFFAQKFNDFGLKKLISVCYKNCTPDLFSENKDTNGIYLIYDGKKFDDHFPDISELEIKNLKGDGDFRSQECIELLKQADIVVTNPPFSLFREYVAQLIEYDKKFIIIGNKNSITYKECFKMIKDNKLWVGVQPMGTDMLFDVSSDFAKQLKDTKKLGSAYKLINGEVKARATACWFTNLDIKKRHEDLPLYKKYTPEEFPTYDNYDAINVDKTSDIPEDYYGIMGVPITFLDKYNPEQFEIIGITKTWFGLANKIYPEQIQYGKDGKIQKGVTKLNDGAVLKIDNALIGKTYYKVGDELFRQVYPKILIKNKKVVK